MTKILTVENQSYNLDMVPEEIEESRLPTEPELKIIQLIAPEGARYAEVSDE